MNWAGEGLQTAILDQFSGAVLLFDDVLALVGRNSQCTRYYPDLNTIPQGTDLFQVITLQAGDDIEELKAQWDKGSITTKRCSIAVDPEGSFRLATFRPLLSHNGLAGLMVQLNPKPIRAALPELTEPLYTNILDYIRDAVMITDAHLDKPGPHILYVNHAFTKMTGYEPQEIYEKSPRIMQGPETDNEGLARLKSNLREKGYFKGETVNYRKSGETFIINWDIVPLKAHDGNVLYYMAIQQEVTEQRKSEQLLKESEEKFRTLAEHSQVGLFFYQDGAFVYVNPRSEAITGYTATELKQTDPVKLAVPEEREAVRQKIEDQVNQQLPYQQYDVTITTKNGERKAVEILATFFNYQGRPALFGSALDVTESRQAFENLRFSQKFNEKIAVTSPNLIAIADYRIMQYTYENGKFQAMIGYTLEEVNGMEEGLLTLMHPEDRPKALRVLEANMNLADAETNQTSFRIQTKDGQYRWFSSTDTPFQRDSEGKPVEILSSVQDITEQQENLDNIREQQQFIQDVTRNSPSFINIYDYEAGAFVYENHSMMAYLGYQPEVLHSRYPLFHPEDREALKAFNEANLQLKDGQVNTIEYRMRQADGQYRWFYNRDVVHKRKANGSVKQVLGLLADVTDEKQALQSLRENEAYFRQLFENAPVAIVTLNLDYRIESCNKAFEQLFGYRAGVLKNVQLDELIVPEDLKREAKHISTMSLSGEPSVKETVRVTKEGHRVPVIVYGVPVFLDGKPVSIYGMYVDITERKQVEDSLSRQTEALKQSNAELEQFAYMTSHHLRSPVVNLLSLMEWFDQSKLQTDENKYIWEKMETSARELNETLADLTYIIGKKERLREPRALVSFESAFKESYELLKPTIDATGAEVTTNFRDAPQIRYLTSFLKSICFHLLSNALQFRHPDRTPKIHFETVAEGQYICLKAFDNGVGINLDRHRYRIFELYQGAHENLTGKGRGLYLVKYQVEALGGYIEVESQVNVGSWFYIYLTAFTTDAA